MEKKLLLLWLLVPVFYATTALSVMWYLRASGTSETFAMYGVDLSIGLMAFAAVSPFIIFLFVRDRSRLSTEG